MGKFRNLPHEQIAAYIRDEVDHETQTQIRKLAAENGGFQLLLEVIDRFKSRPPIPSRPAARPLPDTFAGMEEMLLRFFSGEAGDDEAQGLINGLAASPQFYQRLLTKLELIAPPDEAPELSDIEIRTDEELLAQVKAGAAMQAHPEPATVRKASTVTVLESVRDWFKTILPAPRYAFAISLAIFAGIFLLYHQLFKSANIEDAYVFDEKVPHPYGSGLRGASQSSEENPVYYSFISNFKLGMSDYVVRDYRSAIRTLKNIEPVAQKLVQQLQAGKQQEAKLLRDYYFYLGASHLAVARSHNIASSAAEKTQDFQAAIQCLARADSLMQAWMLLEENDRETYFLGLAYGFSGKPDSALARLNRIQASSQFYQRSVPLIKAWTRD